MGVSEVHSSHRLVPEGEKEANSVRWTQFSRSLASRHLRIARGGVQSLPVLPPNSFLKPLQGDSLLPVSLAFGSVGSKPVSAESIVSCMFSPTGFSDGLPGSWHDTFGWHAVRSKALANSVILVLKLLIGVPRCFDVFIRKFGNV